MLALAPRVGRIHAVRVCAHAAERQVLASVRACNTSRTMDKLSMARRICSMAKKKLRAGASDLDPDACTEALNDFQSTNARRRATRFCFVGAARAEYAERAAIAFSRVDYCNEARRRAGDARVALPMAR